MKASYYNYLAQLDGGKTILFNFLTNNMVEVPADDVQALQHLLDSCNEEVSGRMAEWKRFFVDKSFIVPTEADELQLVRIRNLAKRYDNLVYDLVLMPTLECNFACTYCFESRKAGYMDERVQKGIVNWAEKIARVSKRLAISWYGGEPLLDFSIVEKINAQIKAICAAHQCFFVSDITTNGSLITDEILKKVDDLQINQFQITIDGMPEYHNRKRPFSDGSGSFDVIFPNIFRILRETRARVALRINVDSENLASIPQFLAQIPGEYRTPQLLIAFKDIFSDPGGESGREVAIDQRRVTYQEMKELYLSAINQGFNVFLPAFKIQDHHCNSGNKNYFVVHPSGDLYRCTVEFETGRKVGHLLEDGNIAVDSYTNARWMSYIPGDDQRCANCKFLPMCHGGCRYNRLMGKKPCLLESADLNGVIELYYLAQTRTKK